MSSILRLSGLFLLLACSPTQRSSATNPSNPSLALAGKPVFSAKPGNRGHSNHHRELWVTHQRDSEISILKFPSGELLDGVSLPAGTQPHIVTFHGGKYAYISGMGNGTLSIVDADSRQLVKRSPSRPRSVTRARSPPTAPPCSSPCSRRAASTR